MKLNMKLCHSVFLLFDPDDEERIRNKKYRLLCLLAVIRLKIIFYGAPMQWAAIFQKNDVRITKGKEHLHFYNSDCNRHENILPLHSLR
jgi:hypothetical protein